MKLINCKLVPYYWDTDENSIYINKELSEKLRLIGNSRCKIVFGSFEALAQVLIVPEGSIEDTNIMWLSSSLLKELNVPQNISLLVSALANNEIKFGPVLGILVEKKLLQKYMSGKSTREEFDFYVDAGEDASALVYIFSLYDVCWDEGSVEGYIRIRDHAGLPAWVKQKLPLPDGIHNRISFSRDSPVNEEMKMLQQYMNKLIVINRITAYSKWEVARILQSQPQTRSYMPETKLLQGPETIKEMAEKYTPVYLKPVRRSLGLGIIKITKTELGKYIAYYRMGGNRQREGSIEELLEELNSIMGKRTYIVQQGINLAKYEGRLFDLRVTVQKDGTGKWSLSSWGTRVGEQGSIVTNVAAGGRGIPIELVLGTAFSDSYQSITDQILTVSLLICKALETRINGIGDVGLDIGVDVHGKPYLIEANFRDHRLTADEMDDPDSWAITYKKPVYYLRYLYEQLYS